MVRHLFEAFSTLSDVQELIAAGRTKSANDQVNHAKLHLMAIHAANPESWREAVMTAPITCSPKGGN